jgi:hypothetical protein
MYTLPTVIVGFVDSLRTFPWIHTRAYLVVRRALLNAPLRSVHALELAPYLSQVFNIVPLLHLRVLSNLQSGMRLSFSLKFWYAVITTTWTITFWKHYYWMLL